MINTKILSKANRLVEMKEYKEAEKIYLELLSKNPNSDIIQAFLGRLYIRMRKYKGAERILESAYNKHKTAPTIAALAFCKFKMRKFDDAIILYEELFKFDPDSIKIYDKIIEAFRELEMCSFGHAYAQKLFLKHPESEVAYVRLTQSYLDIGDILKAEEFCAKTIQKFPRSGAAWIIAGNLQEYRYSNEELAQDCYQTAIDYGSVSAYYHLGVSYSKVGRLQEAENAYKRVIEGLPEEDYPKVGLGMLYLSERKLKEGYELFSLRDKSPEIKTLKNQWKGENIENETLLLYCDQGFGDHIQFIRYIPFLKDKVKCIKIHTRESLINIFKRSFNGEKYQNIEFYSELETLGEYDKYVLSSDLPYYLNMDFENIPSQQGYLVVNEEKVKYFKEKYFNTDKLKVGLCWKAGGIGLRSAINRTINIDYLKKLFDIENVQYYSVQLSDIFDGCKKYPITDLKEEINSFDDTASIMKNLDVMISADTSCLHMAGAIGIKKYALLPYCPDWRWFDNDTKTEWYSSVELIKQQDRQNWFIEADILCEKLKGLMK